MKFYSTQIQKDLSRFAQIFLFSFLSFRREEKSHAGFDKDIGLSVRSY